MIKGCREKVRTTIIKFCLVRYDKWIIKYSKIKKDYNLFKIQKYLKKSQFIENFSVSNIAYSGHSNTLTRRFLWRGSPRFK